MVKVEGQNSNRNTAKQTVENGQKELGWRRRDRYYVTGTRLKKFEAAEWCWIQPGKIGWLWHVAHEVIPAQLEHFESLTWPCMIRWHHWRHKRPHVPFLFSLFVWPSSRSFEFQPRTFTIEFYGKKIYQIRAYDFGVQLDAVKTLVLRPVLSTRNLIETMLILHGGVQTILCLIHRNDSGFCACVYSCKCGVSGCSWLCGMLSCR